MDEGDLKNQVENYDRLKITESYRGISVLIAVGLLGISLVLAAVGVLALDGSMILEWAIYAVALFFVLKGHRWAIITVMVLWTADKAVQLYGVASAGEGSVLSIVIWWLVLMPYLYKALRVENERRRIKDNVV